MMTYSLSNREVGHLSVNNPGLINICIHFHSVFHELEVKEEFYGGEKVASPHHGEKDTQWDCNSK